MVLHHYGIQLSSLLPTHDDLWEAATCTQDTPPIGCPRCSARSTSACTSRSTCSRQPCGRSAPTPPSIRGLFMRSASLRWARIQSWAQPNLQVSLQAMCRSGKTPAGYHTARSPGLRLSMRQSVLTQQQLQCLTEALQMLSSRDTSTRVRPPEAAATASASVSYVTLAELHYTSCKLPGSEAHWPSVNASPATRFQLAAAI